MILADLPMLCLNELHEADRIATHANRIIKDKAMEVGFIGLEKMGTGMATSLLRAGYTLTVYNRTPGRDEELVRDGAKRANEIVDACRGDAVITMLADDRALESVVYGDGGMLGSLGKATLHISSSTVSVELSERLMRDHVSAGHRFIWATVFGRPDVAVAGRLSIVAAGVADAVETAMPLLEALGQKVVVVSDTPSHANLAKLSGNFLIAAAIEALGEAIALVEKAGIDKDRYLGTITTALFDLPIYRNYGDIIAARKVLTCWVCRGARAERSTAHARCSRDARRLPPLWLTCCTTAI